MAIETTIYTPRALGKLITRMPPVHTFFRDTLFKNRRTFPTKSVDVDFKKGSRALAPFVHPKVGGKVVPNSGYQTKTYTPVLLAPDKITTVDDLLNRSAGENPYSGRTPAERAVEKLADDLRELNEMIVRREEWMAATAIFTGQIPIIGEGLNEVIDFDFTNKEVERRYFRPAGRFGALARSRPERGLCKLQYLHHGKGRCERFCKQRKGQVCSGRSRL